MRRTAILATFAACQLMMVDPHANATTVVLDRAELSERTRGQLEKLACLQPNGVVAEWIQGYRYPTGIYIARVRCQSHAAYEGRPMFIEAECERHGLRWRCEETWPNIVLEFLGGTVELRLDSVTPERAVGTARFLEGLPDSDWGRLSVERLHGLWLLERVSESTVRASVSGAAYDVTRACESEECTYEISSWALVDY